MKLNFGSLAAILLLVPLAGCARTPYPIPVGTDTFFYGYINQGEKFGVKIGQSREEAESALKNF
jgi:GH24 family phage-related lysozyme (muramidase)